MTSWQKSQNPKNINSSKYSKSKLEMRDSSNDKIIKAMRIRKNFTTVWPCFRQKHFISFIFLIWFVFVAA